MKINKFRGLNTEGAFRYGDLSTDLPNSTAYYKECSQRISWLPDSGGRSNQPVLNGTVGQYIGLDDVFETEIYHGDWCSAEFRTGEGIQVIQGHIIMDEYMWCIDCTGCVGGEIFSVNRPHNFKVIGNIHQNPELLK